MSVFLWPDGPHLSDILAGLCLTILTAAVLQAVRFR